MDARLDATQIQFDPRRPPEWDVSLDGVRIGRVEQIRIGRLQFFEAYVFIEHEPVKLGADTDFDSRCDLILQAHLEPDGVLQVRDWHEQRRRVEEWRASRGQ